MIYRVDSTAQGANLLPYGTNWCDNIYAYLSQYITGLSHEMGTTKIDFGDFTLDILNQRYTHFVVETENNSKEIASVDLNTSRTWIFTLIKTEKFMYFKVNRDWGNHLTIFWLIEDNKHYVGAECGGEGSTSSIYNAVIANISDLQGNNYNFVKILNISVPVNTIAVSDKAPLTDNVMSCIFCTDLLSCSNITSGTVITMKGHNYLALDTNTLIQLDD